VRDPLYLGLRQTRPAIAELDEFVDEFITAVQEEFPDSCIQFEDWAGVDAVRLLARYRDKVCCFNDDMQGTAAVALAGLLAALRITRGKLSSQTLLFLGAGSAETGIADLLVQAMTTEGLSAEAARARIWFFDVNGLMETSRSDLADFPKAIRAQSRANQRLRPGDLGDKAERDHRGEHGGQGFQSARDRGDL
jgi:malate dehydrogenase (oxaloacetate-decarboxylating)(NADP+)